METVLYADVLWLINFSMDFLSLYAAGRLLHLPLRTWRMLLGASVGALYAVMAVALGFEGVWGLGGAVAIAAAMTAVAFGVRMGGRGFFRTFFAVWGSGALLGGVLTVFCGLFDGVFAGGSPADLYGAAAVIVLAFGRLIRSHIHRGYAAIRFTYDENTYTGRALIDSGNLLTDPVSGLPVILLRASDARSFAGDETDGKFRGAPDPDASVRGGVRIVPMRCMGESRLLYGFFCREVMIRVGRRSCCRRAIVCVDHASEGYGGCGALLPASLLP